MKSFILGSSCALALVASNAQADQFLPYTDGRVGGCMLNTNGVLYGCTPQPPQPSQPSQNNRATSSDVPEGRDAYCIHQRQNLKNANTDFHRTVTSMRAAEDRFARSGCSKK